MTKVKISSRVRAAFIVAGILIVSAGSSLSLKLFIKNHSQTITSSTFPTKGSVDLLGSQSQWNMEGAKKVGSKLEIGYTGSSIVHQDGSPGALNPPVNLFGSYLQVTGGFSITTNFSSNPNNTIAFSFYGTPPLIEDEFRAEIGTLDVQIHDNSLTVTVSDQQYGSNAELLHVSIKPGNNHSFTVSDKDGELSFSVDNKTISKTMSDQNIFSTKTVWFGMDELTAGSSYLLNQLQAVGQKGGKVRLVDTGSIKLPSSSNGLAALAQRIRPGFIVGAAVAAGPLVSDPAYQQLIGDNFNYWTIENDSKMQFIHPLPGNSASSYNFGDTDGIINVAEQSGKKIDGHAILFGEALPAWVQKLSATDPEALKQVMIDHIAAVATHEKGKVASWDLNELLADSNTPTGQFGMRLTPWYKAMGPSYVVSAIKTLRKVDPYVKIRVNEFGMESNPDRGNQLMTLLTYLRDNGAPVDVVGFQAHIDSGDTNATDSHIDIASLEQSFNSFASIGVETRVTELDVSNTPQEYPVYADIFTACLQSPNCKGVTVWDPTDKYSSGAAIASNGQIEYSTGAAWDVNEQPTEAINYIRDVLMRQ
jgi:endo-1,4-beta-xylanase